ncbi:MAG: glycosyltransferase family 4 protein [Flavobacteriales bacterium]|nr:glycosyltransferase family 4 protein [Bacteroidota bacterium]MCB9239874.1 glycosyltransferase family 4 protein [Flavobacteriales bacterium]
MSRKTLWVFNQFASTPETNTGAGERHYHLSELISEKGWNTYVFSASYNHLFLKNPSRKFPYSIQKISDHVSFCWMWVNKYNSDSGLQRLLSWLTFCFSLLFIRRKRFGKPDVVLVSSMSIWPVINALLIKLFSRNVKFIFEVRDVWPLTPIYLGNMSRNNPVIRIMFWLEKLAFKYADSIVSVLPGVGTRISEVTPGLEHKFVWIPNAITPELKPVVSTKETSKTFDIIYAGAMGTANALDAFVKAAIQLKDSGIRFRLFGDGPLRSTYVAQTKHQDHIEFPGKVPKHELQKYIASSDLGFIAWENSPLYDYGVSANKYNDYMLCQIPILSVGKIPKDPVKLANAGLTLETNSTDLIISALIKLQNTKEEELKAMGMAGFDYVMKNKTYPVISKSYMKLLEEITAP